jgi:hypothetical protein
MPNLLFKCLTKAIASEGARLNCGPKWTFARRSFLHVFDDHLKCGDWKIEHKDIKDVELCSIRSILFFPGHVLKISTADKTYHFGMHGSRFWTGPLPFPVRRKKEPVSLSNTVIRIIFVGYLDSGIRGTPYLIL